MKKNNQKNESSIVALKAWLVLIVFCQEDVMEEGWLGTVCDLLPYLRCFYTSLAPVSE